MTKRVCDMCGKTINAFCHLTIENYCDYEIFERILEIVRGDKSFDLCLNCTDKLTKLLRERCKEKYEEKKVENE